MAKNIPYQDTLILTWVLTGESPVKKRTNGQTNKRKNKQMNEQWNGQIPERLHKKYYMN